LSSKVLPVPWRTAAVTLKKTLPWIIECGLRSFRKGNHNHVWRCYWGKQV
jgi:hypothetical protein